jgi:predicted alpha/beta hydrolase family esterase
MVVDEHAITGTGAMADTVVFVHSAGPQGPGEGSEPLVRRLREELGGEFEVLFPVMPGTEDEPHYEPWRNRLSAELDGREGKVIVFGHSLGGSVALKYCAEEGFDEKVVGLITAAAPYWGTSDWEEEWALPEGWPATGPRLPHTVLFHSRDDEESPFSSLERYAERLPEATTHALEGNGHLYERGDLSEIAAAVRSL